MLVQLVQLEEFVVEELFFAEVAGDGRAFVVGGFGRRSVG